MYGYVLAPAWSPMSMESHCEKLRAPCAVGWTYRLGRALVSNLDASAQLLRIYCWVRESPKLAPVHGQQLIGGQDTGDGCGT